MSLLYSSSFQMYSSNHTSSVYANYFMLDNARRHNINNISEGSLSNLILKSFFYVSARWCYI